MVLGRHVLHLELAHPPARRCCGDEARRIAGVDVHTDEVRVSDDQRRFTERAELVAYRLDIESRSIDEEFRAVAPSLLAGSDRCGAPARSGRSRRLDVASLRWEPQRRLAGAVDRRRRCDDGGSRSDRPREALEDHCETKTAGIDDVGIAQHLQLIDGPFDRGVGLGDNPVEDDADVIGLGRCRVAGRGGIANDREDGPLGGLHDGPVCDSSRLVERRGDAVRVDPRALRNTLSKAAEDLRQDHAAVAACAHERSVRRGGEDRVDGRRRRRIARLLHR